MRLFSGSFSLPFIIKEAKSNFRGRNIQVIINVFIAILLCVITISYFSSAFGKTIPWKLGGDLFKNIIFFQITLMIILSAATSASSFTIEREELTYDILLTSPISYARIVNGKYISHLLPFIMLTLFSLPLIMICFFLGGVSLYEIFIIYYYTIMSILLFSSAGILTSAFFHRTIYSIPAILFALIIYYLATISVRLYHLFNPYSLIMRVFNENILTMFGKKIHDSIPYSLAAVFIILLCLSYAKQLLKKYKFREYLPVRLIIFCGIILYLFYISGIKLNPDIKGPEYITAISMFFIHLSIIHIVFVIPNIVFRFSTIKRDEEKTGVFNWKNIFLNEYIYFLLTLIIPLLLLISIITFFKTDYKLGQMFLSKTCKFSIFMFVYISFFFLFARLCYSIFKNKYPKIRNTLFLIVTLLIVFFPQIYFNIKYEDIHTPQKSYSDYISLVSPAQGFNQMYKSKPPIKFSVVLNNLAKKYSLTKMTLYIFLIFNIITLILIRIYTKKNKYKSLDR